MLVLTTLNSLLAQLTSQKLHTSLLLTPQGHLVACSSEATLSEDRIRVLVGITSEIWRECIEGERDEALGSPTEGDGDTREDGGDLSAGDEDEVGMLECEFGRILVLPIYSTSPVKTPQPQTQTPNAIPSSRPTPKQPVLLLSLNATDAVPWGLMHTKARTLGRYLTSQLSVFGDRLSPGSSPHVRPRHHSLGWGR